MNLPMAPAPESNTSPEPTAGWSEPAMAAALPGLLVLLALTLSSSGLSTEAINPSVARIGVVLAWPIALWLVARTGRVWIAAAFCIAAGVVLRWSIFAQTGGSDALHSVDEALRTLFGGGNPYDHFYLTTDPPGGVMPYPPAQLLLHLPGWLAGGYEGTRLTEFAAAVVGMAALAWLALRFAPAVGLVGLAVYSGLPNLIQLTGDGSNDTSAGVVVLLAILVVGWAARRAFAGRSAIAAGSAVGLVLATKQSALLFAIALSIYVLATHRPALGRYLGGIAGALVVVSIPFLLLGPLAYVHGVVTIPGHNSTYGWNFWILFAELHWPVADPPTVSAINFVLTAVAMLAVATLCARGLGAAVVGGVVATLVALVTAQWTTPAYFALVLAPLAAVPALMSWKSNRDGGGDDAAVRSEGAVVAA
jgi:hypothetical protein